MRQPVEDEEELQRQAIEEDEVQLAPKPEAVSRPWADGSSRAVESVRSGGVPLPDTARRYFEPRFGTDLGDVQVHTGETAARATAAVSAKAFTLGNSIAFAPGQFDPGGSSGRRLLAHELAHVMQQAGPASGKANSEPMLAGERTPPMVQRKDLNQDSDEGADPGAVDATIGILSEALGQGAGEIERVARQLPLPDVTAALAKMPDATLAILDVLWPDNTGWAAHIKVDGDVNLAATSVGLPFEVAFDGSGAIDVAITRRSGSIAISIAPGLTGGAEGIPSLWSVLEGPFGLHLSGVLGAKLSVDLARVKWPAAALAELFALDIKSALSELMWSALSIGGNTQIEVSGAIGGKLDLGIRGGPSFLATLALKAGGQIGAKVSVVTPTEALPGKIQLSGQFGIFGDFDFKAFGGQGTDPTVFMKNLISAMYRTNVLAVFGLGGLSGSADIGLRYAINLPPYSVDAPPPVVESNWIEVGIFVIGSGGGNLLGQKGAAKGLAEITLQLPDIPGFVAALDDGIDVGDMKLLSLVHGFNANFQVTGTLRNYFGLFPMLIDWFPELAVIEDANYVSVKATATMKATKEQLDAIDERNRNAAINLISRMATGDALEGLRSGADALLESLADVVGFVDKVSFDLAAGTEGMFSVDTPVQKEIGGGGVGGEAHFSRTYHHDATPEELGISTIEQWLRSLIVDDRESYVPDGPRKPYVPDSPRERYGPRRPEPGKGGQVMITNTENVRMVREPKHWDDDLFLVERLPKGTSVRVVHHGPESPFNRTAPEFQWWFVRARGNRGWVMQVLLDEASQAMQ
ncbi:MAG: DUF4157 domain-containing protein [Candidatus Thiodiazotropha sp. (ex Codakia rugifera)]|nr:DUF4157 domain-containing protein [Candidatus Thiodiazotropha sp. (ex Codakia rugifera)]